MTASDLVLLVGEARLEMLPADRGGLARPWHSGIRPNHQRDGDDYNFLGALEFVDRGAIDAGESCIARCRLLVTPEMVGAFVPGFRWKLMQGGQTIGFATLLAVSTRRA